MDKFYEYNGDLMGMFSNENHLNYRWTDQECKILFSVCRQGKAVNCNFASDKEGLRKLKTAIKDFISFVFTSFSWCEMMIAEVKLNSVKRLVRKLGFTMFVKKENGFEYFCYPREAYNG